MSMMDSLTYRVKASKAVRDLGIKIVNNNYAS